MENECKVPQRPGSVKEFFKSWYFWKPVISIVAGAAVGFLFFYFVGCKSGSCAITSNPYSSMITGGILGFFVTSSPCLSCRS